MPKIVDFPVPASDQEAAEMVKPLEKLIGEVLAGKMMGYVLVGLGDETVYNYQLVKAGIDYAAGMAIVGELEVAKLELISALQEGLS